MSYHIRGMRAMRSSGLLGVAILLTMMPPAVILPLALTIALKGASPFLNIQQLITARDGSFADLLISALVANNRLLDLSTITSAVDLNFAGPTQSLVARPRVSMFTAGHQISTNLAAAPPNVVISIDTSTGCGLFAAKAALNRAHVRA